MDILVRYENRKLYSKATNTYVDLKYIKELVDQNRAFKVIEYKSGQDITDVTLKRAIVKLNVSRDVLINVIEGAK